MGRPPPELRECAMLIGWALKDAAWIMLCAPVAFSSALLALCAEVHLVTSIWRDASLALLVHHFADGCWLLGNATWMMAEFLYADKEGSHPGRQFPWYSGPILGFDNAKYTFGVNICRGIFAVGFLALLGFYTLCLLGYASLDGKASAISTREFGSERSMEAEGSATGSQGAAQQSSYSAIQQSGSGTTQQQVAAESEDKRLVFGMMPPELYLHIFIGPWIAKDFAWTFEAKLPLVIFSLVTLALGTDYVRRFHCELVWAQLLWMIGDTVWAYGEVWVDDRVQLPRSTAAVLLVLALMSVVGGAMRTLGAAGEARSQLLAGPVKDEAKPLALAMKNS